MGFIKNLGKYFLVGGKAFVGLVIGGVLFWIFSAFLMALLGQFAIFVALIMLLLWFISVGWTFKTLWGWK